MVAPLVAPSPSLDARKEISERGGSTAVRCYQCGTCSSVCDLIDAGPMFPRRQVRLTQWGLVDQLAADPGVWLCHQCNDCTVRCPRDAKPGDVMQTARSMVIEHMAVPRFMGRLVAHARSSWPLLLGLPIALWAGLVAAAHGLSVSTPPYPSGSFAYELYVPHWLIYAVTFPVAGLVVLALTVSGLRFWRNLDGAEQRSGSFLAHLLRTLVPVSTHSRFGSCTAARSRRWSHMALFWGFVGAAVTSGLLIVALYGMDAAMPLPQSHPIKLLGNASAVLMVVGCALLVFNRLTHGREAGGSTAFDTFFLGVVCLVVLTGVLIEGWRLAFPPQVGAWIYIVHLGAVLSMFLTFPYSKFAHVVYRTLAMVHCSMTAGARRQGHEIETSRLTTASPAGESS